MVKIKKGKSIVSVLNDVELAERIISARGIALDIDSLTPAFREYKDYIVNVARNYLDGAGTLTFVVDFESKEVDCKVTFGYECVIPPENVAEVQRILGSRFDDLVRTKVRYEGTSKLIDYVAEHHAEEIKKLLTVREKAASVSFS